MTYPSIIMLIEKRLEPVNYNFCQEDEDMSSKIDLSLDTISIKDVFETYKKYSTLKDTEKGKADEAVLGFISELTGLSVDTIMELCG